MENSDNRGPRSYTPLVAVFVALVFVAGLFIFPGFVGGVTVESGSVSYAGTTALSNMTESITELITEIIPIFVLIGIFGVIISMITGMMKKFGN